MIKNVLLCCSEEVYKTHFEYLNSFKIFNKIEKFNNNFEDSTNNLVIIDYDFLHTIFDKIKHKYIFSPIILLIDTEIDYDILLDFSFDEYIFKDSLVEENIIRLKNVFKKKSWEISLRHVLNSQRIMLNEENITLKSEKDNDIFSFINFLTTLFEINYESKYKYLSQHSKNVGTISGIIFEEQNYSSSKVTLIEWSGFFHDLYVFFLDINDKSDFLNHNRINYNKNNVLSILNMYKNIFFKEMFDILIEFIENKHLSNKIESKVLSYVETLDIKIYSVIENKNNAIDILITNYINSIKDTEIKNLFISSKNRIISFYNKLCCNYNNK